MKAAVCTEYGPADLVRIEDIPPPVPGPDQVLVKVHATTVNRTRQRHSPRQAVVRTRSDGAPPAQSDDPGV